MGKFLIYYLPGRGKISILRVVHGKRLQDESIQRTAGGEACPPEAALHLIRQRIEVWLGKMRLYALHDQEGRIFAFEISNSFLGRPRVCRIVATFPGVRIIRLPKFLSDLREEAFCDSS